MSKSLSNLEIEPEWCSVVVLSSISAAESSGTSPQDVPIASAAEVPIESPAENPAASTPNKQAIELSTSKTMNSLELPKITVTLENPKRVASKPQSESKSARSIISATLAESSRWSEVLRSRRLRVIATVASVLIVGSLMFLNLKSDTPVAVDGAAEMDLSEFNDVAGLDEPHIGKPLEAPPQELASDLEAPSPVDRFPRMTSGPRLPPLGLVTHADHETLPDQTARGFVPASATSTGSRGAVLTGQIEFDAPQRPMETSAGLFRSFGRR